MRVIIGAIMAYSSHGIEQRIQCKCGRFEWREVITAAAVGLVAMERKCRRCKQWFVLVFRIRVGTRPRAEHVATIEKRGPGEADLRRALQETPGITADEVEFLLAVARDLGAPKGAIR